jgi:hypothetical protein
LKVENLFHKFTKKSSKTNTNFKNTTFENFIKRKNMKQFLYILVFAAVGIFAMIEQSKPAPNRFIMIGAMAVFMFGLFRLMKKIPSKNDGENENKNDTEV